MWKLPKFEIHTVKRTKYEKCELNILFGRFLVSIVSIKISFQTKVEVLLNSFKPKGKFYSKLYTALDWFLSVAGPSPSLLPPSLFMYRSRPVPTAFENVIEHCFFRSLACIQFQSGKMFKFFFFWFLHNVIHFSWNIKSTLTNLLNE